MKWPSLQPWLRSRKIYSISKWPPGVTAGWNTHTPGIQMQQNTHMHPHATFTIRDRAAAQMQNPSPKWMSANDAAVSCSRFQLVVTHDWNNVLVAAKFSELILLLKAFAHHPLACKCDGGSSGDDNDINGCPKTSPKKFPYFVPWASAGRAWH